MSLFNLSDGDLLRLCTSNSSIDPNCACLLSGGGPEMNTDISGPGVRISFYLQALFLGLMSARSASVDENTSALYTLVATNVAMVVTSFILGFKPEPGMSFHDAIVVFYMLSLSWAAIFFCLPTYNRFKRSDRTLKILYILHSYLIFAFFLAVLIIAQTFGSTPRCNGHAVAVIFGSFPALTAGRVAALVAIGMVILTYSLLLINDYRNIIVVRCRESREFVKGWMEATAGTGAQATFAAAHQPEQRTEHDVYSTGISGRLVIEIFVIIVLWSLFVMNSELLIVRNRFEGGSGISSNLWGFGQLLPIFLVVLPFVNLTKTFLKWKLYKRRHDVPVHRTHLDSGRQSPLYSEFGGQGFGLGLGQDFAHGQRHGPSPASPRWAGDGNGRRAEPDFMRFFLQQPGAARTRPDGRQQPSARISVNSIHSGSSSDFAHNVRDDDDWNKGETSSSSVSISSSSASRTDGYATAEGEDSV